MKRLSIFMMLGLVLMQSAAYANTVWGTVNSVSGDTVQVSVMNSDDKGVPSSLSATVKDASKLEGIQPGDQVKLNVKAGDDGTYEAKSIEKTDRVPVGQAAGTSTGADTTATS